MYVIEKVVQKAEGCMKASQGKRDPELGLEVHIEQTQEKDERFYRTRENTEVRYTCLYVHKLIPMANIMPATQYAWGDC